MWLEEQGVGAMQGRNVQLRGDDKAALTREGEPQAAQWRTRRHETLA